jgi:hypothetical protein
MSLFLDQRPRSVDSQIGLNSGFSQGGKMLLVWLFVQRISTPALQIYHFFQGKIGIHLLAFQDPGARNLLHFMVAGLVCLSNFFALVSLFARVVKTHLFRLGYP